jgi:hypothetical protein
MRLYAIAVAVLVFGLAAIILALAVAALNAGGMF